MTRSAAKIDHIRTGGTLLNQKFLPQVLADDAGITKALDPFTTFFDEEENAKFREGLDPTYGGVGALGTPVVRTDAAALWAIGTVWWQVPRTIKVNLEGAMKPGVTGKDVIITLCGMYNQGEVLNAVIEFGGTGIAGLSIEERLTIANMTTEWGALAGWFPVDKVTVDYVAGGYFALPGGVAFHAATGTDFGLEMIF